MRPLSLILALAGIAGSASASIITYNTFGELQAAATLTTTEDFQSYTVGTHHEALGTQGVSILLEGLGSVISFYVDDGANLTNPAQCGTQCLTANGNEVFTMGLTGGGLFTAIGFDVVTNQYAAPVVSVYGTSGLIGSYTLTQGPNTKGYFGLVSDEQITSVEFRPTGGQIQDTAIDNITIGTSLISQAPEPAVGFFGSVGLLGLLAAMRRRSATAQRG